MSPSPPLPGSLSLRHLSLQTRKVTSAGEGGGGALRIDAATRIGCWEKPIADQMETDFFLYLPGSCRDRLAEEIRWREETKGEAMGRGGKG